MAKKSRQEQGAGAEKKTGARTSPAPVPVRCLLLLFAASCSFYLEAQLARDLNATCVVGNGVVDASEDRRGEDGGRIVKRRAIQNVARIHTEIETHALGNSESLRERRIPLEVVRREEEIAPRISD